jgi:hypothetical protein
VFDVVRGCPVTLAPDVTQLGETWTLRCFHNTGGYVTAQSDYLTLVLLALALET